MALASRIACRNEPAPESLLLVTTNVRGINAWNVPTAPAATKLLLVSDTWPATTEMV